MGISKKEALQAIEREREMDVVVERYRWQICP